MRLFCRGQGEIIDVKGKRCLYFEYEIPESFAELDPLRTILLTFVGSPYS